MSLANFLDPDTLVRSPILTKSEFSSILSGSNPLNFVMGLILGIDLGEL